MTIALDSVTVEYDRDLPTARSALRSIDLVFDVGGATAVMGSTGSGKTTLLEVAAGLRSPDAGSARLDGDDSPASLRSAVGLVYQFPESQFFEETVAADVGFGPRQTGVTDAEIDERVAESLSRAGLDPGVFGPRSPISLSAGEKRRAAIACILALERPFLLLDEPTAGLDPVSRRRVVELVEAEKESGRSVVLVTHDPEIADRLAERVVVLRDGEVAAEGSPERIFGDGALADAVGLSLPPRYELVRRIALRSAERARLVAGILDVPEPWPPGPA